MSSAGKSWVIATGPKLPQCLWQTLCAGQCGPGIGAEGRLADKLAIGFEDFGGQCQSYVSRWSEVLAQDEFGVRVGRGVIPEHNPVVPTELTYVADVSRTSSHNGLWHFAIGHVDVIAGRRADKRFQLNAVIPESLWGTSPDHFS